MIDRAGALFVIKRRHRNIISERFIISDQPVIVPEICYHYWPGDPELIEIIKDQFSTLPLK